MAEEAARPLTVSASGGEERSEEDESSDRQQITEQKQKHTPDKQQAIYLICRAIKHKLCSLPCKTPDFLSVCWHGLHL